MSSLKYKPGETGMHQAISIMEEALRGDLERCVLAIRADDKQVAIAELERAFAKLDSALDLIRNQTH
jgi:hypothetical protein